MVIDMKKYKKIFLIILCILSILLISCNKEKNQKKNTYEYELINLYEEGISYIDDFDLSYIKLRIKTKDTILEVDVNESMIEPSDLDKLKEPGFYDIKVKYGSFEGVFSIILLEKNDVIEPDDQKYKDYNTFDLDGYYKDAVGLVGNDLKLALRAIISVQKIIEKYDNLRQDLQITDVSLENKDKIYDFYTHEEMNITWDSGKTWNREHVWPRSKAWYQYDGAGADIHCVRPVNSRDNSSRGNKAFGTDSYHFNPDDCSKGDVARIIFYMLVRYEEAESYSITNVAQSMEMLLDWNAFDPVDDIERQRNNESYKIQGNRNPFIDFSDYAYLIWDNSRLNIGYQIYSFNSFITTSISFAYFDNRYNLYTL